jgi:hypothetical protein
MEVMGVEARISVLSHEHSGLKDFTQRAAASKLTSLCIFSTDFGTP